MAEIPVGSRIHYRNCPLCEAHCGIAVEIDAAAGQVLGIRGDPEDEMSAGYICPEGLALKGVHEDPDRLRQPLLRRIGASSTSRGTRPSTGPPRSAPGSRHPRPDAVATYIGNPTGHDFGAMLYTALFIQALGTERVFTGATVDQFPKNMSCRLMYGDSWLFPIPDIDRTDFFVVVGANPLVSNGSLMSAPDMRSRLRAHRERGGTLVVVDPRRTETAAVADRHLAIRPGADAFLLFALIEVFFAEDLVAPGRLSDFTDGVDDRAASLRGTSAGSRGGGHRHRGRRDPPARARFLRRRAGRPATGAFGTCTQEFGTLTSWLVDVVNILTGNFDRPGGLMFPRAATGQTEPVAEASGPVPYARFRSRVRGFPEFDGQLPAACMAEEIDSAGDERVRAMITVAGNPVLSTPNGARLSRALEQLDFMVSVDIYMNETTRLADLILPTTTQLEHENYDFLFQTTSVRNMARHSPRVFEAPADARHHWQVLLELAAGANGVTADTLDDLLLAGVIATFVGRPGSASREGDCRGSPAKHRRSPRPGTPARPDAPLGTLRRRIRGRSGGRGSR